MFYVACNIVAGQHNIYGRGKGPLPLQFYTIVDTQRVLYEQLN